MANSHNESSGLCKGMAPEKAFATALPNMKSQSMRVA